MCNMTRVCKTFLYHQVQIDYFWTHYFDLMVPKYPFGIDTFIEKISIQNEWRKPRKCAFKRKNRASWFFFSTCLEQRLLSISKALHRYHTSSPLRKFDVRATKPNLSVEKNKQKSRRRYGSVPPLICKFIFSFKFSVCNFCKFPSSDS